MLRLNRDQALSIFVGILASLGLVLFYVLVLLLLTKDWQFPLKQFWVLRYWMTALVLGFGIQVGLFHYLRAKRKNVEGASVAAGAGVSGGAMVACCVHHLTEIIPILGLSGLSFIAGYQRELLILGVLTNAVGISLMIKRMRQAKC